MPADHRLGLGRDSNAAPSTFFGDTPGIAHARHPFLQCRGLHWLMDGLAAIANHVLHLALSFAYGPVVLKNFQLSRKSPCQPIVCTLSTVVLLKAFGVG